MPNLLYMQKLYEQLHQHPELSLQENWTGQFIATELNKLGFKVRTGVGKTGVVGTLEFDRPGSVLALRSDMDALAIQEETGVNYSSQNQGVMHACGHDSHMAMLLGTCAYAVQNKHLLSGTLVAVFQPAEEIVVGAKAMLEDDIFGSKKPDRLIGVHNWPSLPAGSLGLQSGPITAFADRFKVAFKGSGGHGAMPHKTKDPIAMATAGIQGAFSLTHRGTNAANPQVLSIGIIKGGTSFNVIPEEVIVEGTVRTMWPEDQANMIKLLHQAFGAGAALYGGEYELYYQKGVPGVVNDGLVVEELTELLQRRTPEIPLVNNGLSSLIGEDLAFFLQEVPGALLFVGSGQEGAVNELHNPRFLVPSQTLATGYQGLTTIIEGYLSK